MGRPRGEGSVVLRVPTGFADEVRGLVAGYRRTLATLGERTDSPKVVPKRTPTPTKPAPVPVETPRTQETPPVDIEAVLETPKAPEPPAGYECPICHRTVPDRRYIGRKHQVTCSKYDRTVE